MRKSILLMLAILTLGCVAELTIEDSSVQIVDDKSSCEFLGTVTGYNTGGGNMAHNTDGAMNDLRNKAAQIGCQCSKDDRR